MARRKAKNDPAGRESARDPSDEQTTPQPKERSGVPKSQATLGTVEGKAIHRGPRKARGGGPGRRWSNHKRREAPIAVLLTEKRKALTTLPAAPGAAQWEMAGPTNVGGRCTSIVCDPQNPDHILLGSAGGGVWRSDDGGRNWAISWDQEQSLNIGSLAVDPSNANLVYCGTGEANLSADSYPGVGVFRSEDRGLTWALIAPSDTSGVPRRIGALAIDPSDSTHVLAGGIGYSDAEPGGLYASADRGENEYSTTIRR